MKKADKLFWLLLLVIVLLLLCGCRTSRKVERVSTVERVGERVFTADSLAHRARSERRDSVSERVVRADSVVVVLQDSVRECLVVDTAGNILGRDIWHTTNRFRDSFHFGNTHSSAVLSRSATDSIAHAVSVVSHKDSTLLKDSCKMTENREVQPKAVAKAKKAVTHVRNGIRTVLAIVGGIVALLVIIAVVVYRKWGIKLWRLPPE